jgi:uncharacterized membrane protein YeaQ/YmgE (transglycosylase-associated protein family)
MPRPSAHNQIVAMDQTRAYWLCQIGGWATYAATRVVLYSLFHPVTWKHVVGNAVIAIVGLFYTHLYRAVIHRQGWRRMSIMQLAPRVVGASIVVAALLHFTVDPIGRYLLEFDFYQQIESELGLMVGAIANGSFLILIWSLIYFGVHAVWSHRRAEVDRWKMKAQMESTKLKALKLQLNPHFLFNSLNSVRALIVEDAPRAQRMVTELAGLLRKTLRSGETSTVTLQEELRTVRSYLDLEAVRFEERLRYQIEVPEAVRVRSVPFLLVQTLVENGIKHGVAKQPEGGRIVISAEEEDERLYLRVDNTGRLDPAAITDGVGMGNARERLTLLFGDDASLRVYTLDDTTVRAEVILPPLPASRPVPGDGDHMPNAELSLTAES